jgi:DNA-binding HxlR family transcriptional regulator
LTSPQDVHKRRFREFLQADETISSNILADRLKVLVDHGILTKTEDPTHKQKAIYRLTEAGLALLPILIQIGRWGRKYRPVTKKGSAVAAALERGGPKPLNELEAKLRRERIGVTA